jgi:hypothetical protein
VIACSLIAGLTRRYGFGARYCFGILMFLRIACTSTAQETIAIVQCASNCMGSWTCLRVIFYVASKHVNVAQWLQFIVQQRCRFDHSSVRQFLVGIGREAGRLRNAKLEQWVESSRPQQAVNVLRFYELASGLEPNNKRWNHYCLVLHFIIKYSSTFVLIYTYYSRWRPIRVETLFRLFD